MSADWLLGQTAPAGCPLAGEFIDLVDELASAAFWPSMRRPQRHHITDRAAGLD
jgi:hypothetical protein